MKKIKKMLGISLIMVCFSSHLWAARTIERVSIDNNGVEASGSSSRPKISSDGRYVSFWSAATNFVVGDTNVSNDVFVYDRTTNTIERVSIDNNGNEGDDSSLASSISSDGRYIAFESDATNLVVGDTNAKRDVFVYDRDTDTIERVSVDNNGNEGDDESHLPSISLDGRYVAFRSVATKEFREKHKDLVKKLDNIEIYTIGRDVAPMKGNVFYKPDNIHMLSWVAGPVAKSFEAKLLGGPGSNTFLVEGVKKLIDEFKGEIFNILDLKKNLDMQRPRGRKMLWHQTMERIYTILGLKPIAKVFNSKDPLKKEELMEKQVIIEIDEAFPEDLANLFIDLHVYFVILHWLTKGESNNLRYVVGLEEAHNFFGTNYTRSNTEEVIERLFRQISGFGVGMITITQLPHLLPPTASGNACVQIQLGIQHGKDLMASRESFGLKPGEEEYFQRLEVGEGIVTCDNRIKPCVVKFRYLPTIKGQIKDDEVKERYAKNKMG